MQTNLPIIYVVTVCRNAESLIEPTMQSVLHQTYPNVRYVVVDGASTDGTMQIVQKYADRLSACVSEPDKGIYDAMNKALGLVRRLEKERLADGSQNSSAWVNFMNAGDAFADDNVLWRVFGEISFSDSVMAVGGHTLKVYPKGREEKLFAAGAYATRQELPFCHQSSFVRITDQFIWQFNRKYKIAADYALFYEIFERYGAESIKTIDMIIARYKMDGSTTFNQLTRAKQEYLAIQSGHKDIRWWKEWIKLKLHMVNRK